MNIIAIPFSAKVSSLPKYEDNAIRAGAAEALIDRRMVNSPDYAQALRIMKMLIN